MALDLSIVEKLLSFATLEPCWGTTNSAQLEAGGTVGISRFPALRQWPNVARHWQALELPVVCSHTLQLCCRFMHKSPAIRQRMLVNVIRGPASEVFYALR
jgi:hypothetical protein